MNPTTDKMTDRLLAMDNAEFEEIVNADTRGRLDDPLVGMALRADPRLTRKWYHALMTMHKTIEGQFAVKTRDNSAKIKGLKLANRSKNDIMTEEASFEKWSAGAMRVKTALEVKLIECKALLEQRGDRYILDRTAEERNQALGRIGVLEHAIRTHRQSIMADEGLEYSDSDLALWAFVDAP